MSYGNSQFQRIILPHEQALKSMRDLLVNQYHCQTQNRVDSATIPFIITPFQNRARFTKTFNTAEENAILEALKGGWYYQYMLEEVLNHPSWGGLSMPLNFSLFYHSILLFMTAMVKIINPNVGSTSSAKIRTFNQAISSSPRYTNYIVFPFQTYFDLSGSNISPAWANSINWPYGLTNHCPPIEAQLINITPKGNDQVISLINYFRSLRELVQYQQVPLVSYLYGPSVVANMKNSLSEILYCFSVNAESFVGTIMSNGFSKVQTALSTLAVPLTSNFNVSLSHVQDRLNVYSTISW